MIGALAQLVTVTQLHIPATCPVEALNGRVLLQSAGRDMRVCGSSNPATTATGNRPRISRHAGGVSRQTCLYLPITRLADRSFPFHLQCNLEQFRVTR